MLLRGHRGPVGGGFEELSRDSVEIQGLLHLVSQIVVREKLSGWEVAFVQFVKFFDLPQVVVEAVVKRVLFLLQSLFHFLFLKGSQSLVL